MKVLLFGATGSAGGSVLRVCLSSPAVEEVRVITRRPLRPHEKLREFIHGDYLDYSAVADAFTGVDACFYCLGISATQVPEEADYRKITHSFALAAAKELELRSPSAAFHFLSGQGASLSSCMMWARVKAETERDLIGLVNAVCWRPGYIDGEDSQSGPRLYQRLRPFFRLFKPVRSLYITGEDIGRAMIESTLRHERGRIVENAEIRRIADATKGRRAVACAVLFLFFVAAASARAGEDVPAARFTDPARREKLVRALPAIDAKMADEMRELHLPGLAYGVIVDGELVLARGLGDRDIKTKAGTKAETKAPVDADTVFRIASMTKSFTALAVLKLRDEGKLALDDPVARYVPELAALPPPTEDSGPVTLRQLLSHTAGFPEDNPWGDRQLADSEEELSAKLRQGIPFSTAPGTGFEYSNYGFAILGRVVSRVSGIRYQDYIDREILKPLGMTSTFWNPQDVPRERLATGYRRQGEEWIAEKPLADGAFGALGGLLTSSRDLGRWVALMLSAWPPRDDPERPPALRRTLREMQQGAGVVPFLFANRTVPGAPLAVRGASYAFALFSAADCRFRLAVSHSGGLPGFGSDMRWLPEQGVGVFAMANVTYAPAVRLTREMLDILADTGALEPRRPVPAPALLQAVEETAHLLDVWDDARAQALAAENLFLDRSLKERKEEIAKLRDGLGACRMGDVTAQNALRGRFRMSCDKGWLDATLTLAPTQPPKVQALSVTGGRPLSEGLSRAVDAVLGAVVRGGQNLRLSPSLDRAALGALLTDVRLHYGACRAGEPLEGDGTTRALVKLDCDSGPLSLSLRLDGDQVSELRFDRPADAVCPP